MIINFNNKLESELTGHISEVVLEPIHFRDKDETQNKVSLVITLSGGEIITTSEVMMKDYKGAYRQTGLWLKENKNSQISALSALGRFLNKMRVSQLKDLKNRQVCLTHGKKEFLVIWIKD